ncbi:siderophore-iron reductase FhuF [Escherichia coli]|nr:siderophore-iron reductase FhuF [Escherichia coli]
MAYRSAPLYEDVIWRTHLQPQDAGLAQAVRATIAEHREHLLEFIRLDEPAPLRAMTLAQWSSPNALSSLLAVYSDHIYRNQPTMIRENKPLISLWAQWYIGLMVPPLMLALLTQEKALDVSPEHFHVEFHETGRAACFWVDVCEDNPLWRTVVLRDGLLVRRTCCQRYRLPDVQQCGDCTLK